MSPVPPPTRTIGPVPGELDAPQRQQRQQAARRAGCRRWDRSRRRRVRGAAAPGGRRARRASSTSAMSPRHSKSPSSSSGMVGSGPALSHAVALPGGSAAGIMAIAWRRERSGRAPGRRLGLVGDGGSRAFLIAVGRRLPARRHRRSAVAALWAFTILPAIAALRHRARELPAAAGHQGLRRQRRAASPSSTSSGASSCPSPRSPRRCATPSSPPRTRASTPTGASIPSASRARSTRTTGAGASSRAAARSPSSSPRCSSSRPDKSLERKLKEAVLALELERRYSKDRILEMYLNQIYFGHGAYGVEAAARTYFGKSVSELNRARGGAAGRPARGARPPTRRSSTPRPPSAAARSCCAGWWTSARSRTPSAKRLARRRSRPHPARAAAHHRPVLPRVRPAAARGASTAPTWCSRAACNVYTTLNPTDAARGRAGAARRAQGARERGRHGKDRPRRARASRGRARHHRAADRLRHGDGRRLRLLQERVQPRRAGPPAARARPSSRSSTSPRSSPASPRPARRRRAGRRTRRAATARRGSPRTTTASSAARPRCSRRSRSRSTW